MQLQESYLHIATHLEQLNASVDFEAFSGDSARSLVKYLDRISRIAASGKAQAAARVEATNAFRKSGSRDAATWLAAETGVEVGEARQTIETGKSLAEFDDLRKTYTSGGLSDEQAAAVSAGASADRSAEQSLLNAAPKLSVSTLKRKSRSLRRNASEDDHERQRRSQYIRTWTSTEGMGEGHFKLLPENLARLKAALDSETEVVFAEARKSGRRDSPGLYQAEALINLVEAKPSDSKVKRHVVTNVFVDYEVLATTDNAAEGGTCEIEGVGPISQGEATRLANDSILKVLVRKNGAVEASFAAGGPISDKVRAAVNARDGHCVVPGCGQERRTQLHHYRLDRAKGGKATPGNLCRICSWHHYLVTHRGYKIDNHAGEWKWITPNDHET